MVTAWVNQLDVEVSANLPRVVELLRMLGFKHVKTSPNGTLDARMKKGLGRIHVLGLQVGDNNTYLDVHWDFLIHFTFLGVDYAKRPAEVVNGILREAMKAKIPAKQTGGTSWLSRKNRALLRGIRLSRPC